MPRKSKLVSALESFVDVFTGEVTDADLDIIEARTATISPEIIDFVRQSWTPWIERAISLDGTKLVRIPRAVPSLIRQPKIDADGNQVIVDGEPAYEETTAEDLATKFQVALNASRSGAEAIQTTTVNKANETVEVFARRWLVRVGPATTTDAGYSPDVRQSVFKLVLTDRRSKADREAIGDVDQVARQAERAETAAKIKTANGKQRRAS